MIFKNLEGNIYKMRKIIRYFFLYRNLQKKLANCFAHFVKNDLKLFSLIRLILIGICQKLDSDMLHFKNTLFLE